MIGDIFQVLTSYSALISSNISELRLFKISQEINSLAYNNIQIMPGLEGDLEECQTQEVNVTRGEAKGDIDLEGLPFLKVIRGPSHYLLVIPGSSTFSCTY